MLPIIFTRCYTVYNLAYSVTILNSTSKGQANARESAYQLKILVRWDKVAIPKWWMYWLKFGTHMDARYAYLMSLAKYCR